MRHQIGERSHFLLRAAVLPRGRGDAPRFLQKTTVHISDGLIKEARSNSSFD